MGSKPDAETSKVRKKRLAGEKFGLGMPGQHGSSSKKAKDSGSGGICEDGRKEKGKVACDEISSEQVLSSGRKLGPFFDFDKNRASMTFQEGNILTIRDEYGMPRRYARVEKNGEIRYLKADGHDLPVPYRAVGEFLIGSNSEFLDPLFISHKLLGWEMDNSSSYRVFPKKGEIWAILASTGVSYNKQFHPFPAPSPTLEKYELVEVLEDYNSENGTKVVSLVRVGKGNRSLFRRMITCGKEISINISRRCMELIFSHQVPCFRASGDETIGNCLQLDPSSIPLYIEEFELDFACEINDNTLCLGLFDLKVLKERFRFGDSNMAAYDEKCGLPLKYVTNKSEQGQLKSGLFTHDLVPAQERWPDPGFPIACGIYKKKPRTTEHRLIISHNIYPSGCVLGNDFYRIRPRRGDVWAIFKERKMVKRGHPKESLDYRIGYIVDERDTVREVAYLVRVDGFKCLFRIKSASETELIHEEDEFEKFSHQIPSYRFPTSCGEKILEGSIVLDPLLVPKNGEECFSFSDSFLLERSKAHPQWLAVQHIIDIEWNRLSLNSQEKIGKQAEEEDINVIEDQEIHKSEERGRNPEVSAHGTKGIESESNGNETSCKQFTLKFHNFYDSESEENFELGQIWALYDEYEGLPHLYARIDKFSPSDGRMEVTPLEPHPMTDTEIHWIEERLPMACGTFRMSKSTCVKDVTLFSYRIICGEGKTSKCFYKIFPRKGEVWAIFKNWNPTWTSNDLTKNLEYILVEVLSSFTEKRGVTVAALVRAGVHEAIFRRQLNGCFELIKTFARNELLRFSHCIPFRKMSMDEEGNTCGGSIQLKFSHKGI